MGNLRKADVTVGTGIMEAFTRMPVETEQLLREFIDNSTTSYFDHRDCLDKIVESRKCVITIDWDDSQIVILDNAYGMNEEEFKRALKPNARAKNYSEDSRGQYGLGLKYAALNLGSWYSIETTAYNSNELYYAEIDLEELKKNIETVDYKVNEAPKEKHYTKITIKQLDRTIKDPPRKRAPKQTKESKLRTALSYIYRNDITNLNLDLYLNNIKITYDQPEYKQKENGGEWFTTFDDTFEFAGKTYTYHGWAAILAKASVSNAGFMLLQKDRAIQLNYRPEDLFGKSNDFRYQRVIGEVSLDGNSWVVTFQKNAIKWDDFGLEDRFIQSLKDNASLTEIFNYARKHRIKEENVTAKQLERFDLSSELKTSNSANTVPKSGTSVIPKAKPATGISNPVSIPASTPSQTASQPSQPAQVIQPTPMANPGADISIEYAGKNYTFEVIPTGEWEKDAPWIKINAKDADSNAYRVFLNARVKAFDAYNDTKAKKLITKLAICVALCQLSSKRRGLNTTDSQKFIDELNEILSALGKED